jgi:hypothetical protein
MIFVASKMVSGGKKHRVWHQQRIAMLAERQTHAKTLIANEQGRV